MREGLLILLLFVFAFAWRGQVVDGFALVTRSRVTAKHARRSHHTFSLRCEENPNNDNGQKEDNTVASEIFPMTTMSAESTAPPPAAAITLTAAQIPETVPKLWNAVLLASSFFFVLYTILNVDADFSRGWSFQETMQRLPYDNWRNYEGSLEESPVLTKTTINVVIYLLGDWLSQTVFQGQPLLNFDSSRTLRNGFIGLCFGPLVHYYYQFSDFILPVDVVTNRFWKIVMDQTIYLGVKCSIYIFSVDVLNGGTTETASDNVKTKIRPVMIKAWKFWPLVHCVTYGVIPGRHRVLWVNAVDLIWNGILAGAAAKGGGDIEEKHVGEKQEKEPQERK